MKNDIPLKRKLPAMKKCFNLRWMSINAVLSFHYQTVLNAKLKVKSQEKLQSRRWPCELRTLAASEKATHLGKEKFADIHYNII
jgi:hypothetical protein